MHDLPCVRELFTAPFGRTVVRSLRDTQKGTADCEEGVVRVSNNDIYSPPPSGGVPRVATTTSAIATVPCGATTGYGVGLETQNVGVKCVGGANSADEGIIEKFLSSVGGTVSDLSHENSGGVFNFTMSKPTFEQCFSSEISAHFDNTKTQHRPKQTELSFNSTGLSDTSRLLQLQFPVCFL